MDLESLLSLKLRVLQISASTARNQQSQQKALPWPDRLKNVPFFNAHVINLYRNIYWSCQSQSFD